METEGPTTKNQTLNDIMKRSSSSSSEILSPLHSPHSPFRSEHGDLDPVEPQKTPSPHVSRAASPSKPSVNNCKALITVDKPTQFNPNSLPSLSLPLPPATPPQQPLNLTVNRSVREDKPAMTRNNTKANNGAGGGRGARAVAAVLRRSKVKETVKMAALGFRLSEIVLCLISLSVMAADKTSGWSGDSFDRYKEYRYCLSVTVIGFVYAGFQVYALAYYLVAQKHVIRILISPWIRYYPICCFQQHLQRPHELMSGNLVGAKMNSRRWLLPQFRWPFWHLHSARFYLVTNSVPMILHDLRHNHTRYQNFDTIRLNPPELHILLL